MRSFPFTHEYDELDFRVILSLLDQLCECDIHVKGECIESFGSIELIVILGGLISTMKLFFRSGICLILLHIVS